MSFPNKISLLIDRAKQLQIARDYFVKKNICEVQIPCLVKYPTLDANIETMQVQVFDHQDGYLHTSPEYLMKRLLSYGMDDIYYLGPVFRKNESGKHHNPEFTMVEWYRKDIALTHFIEEVLEFLHLFLGKWDAKYFTYHEIFQEAIKIDIDHITKKDLIDFLQNDQIANIESLDFDTLLQLIFAFHIEKKLISKQLVVIQDYPPSQAMLAKIANNVAKRFEVFYQGVELANGYHELTDAKEQKMRFINENNKRKVPLPIDPSFIKALEQGIGDCCGVAIGFDRLLMLKNKLTSLHNTTSFHWEEL